LRIFHGRFACAGVEQRFLVDQVFGLRAGETERRKLLEGAVDGIGDRPGAEAEQVLDEELGKAASWR
jgi:hypothetical protein